MLKGFIYAGTEGFDTDIIVYIRQMWTGMVILLERIYFCLEVDLFIL